MIVYNKTSPVAPRTAIWDHKRPPCLKLDPTSKQVGESLVGSGSGGIEA